MIDKYGERPKIMKEKQEDNIPKRKTTTKKEKEINTFIYKEEDKPTIVDLTEDDKCTSENSVIEDKKIKKRKLTK